MSKLFKVQVIVLCVMLFIVSAAFGAIVPQNDNRTEGDYQQELPDGTIVCYKGFALGRGTFNNYLWLNFSVTTNKDMDITIGQAVAHDENGEKFILGDLNNETFIGNIKTKTRDVIEGVATVISQRSDVNKNYKLPAMFPRVRITVNGNMVEFRNVPAKL